MSDSIEKLKKSSEDIVKKRAVSSRNSRIGKYARQKRSKNSVSTRGSN